MGQVAEVEKEARILAGQLREFQTRIPSVASRLKSRTRSRAHRKLRNRYRWQFF